MRSLSFRGHGQRTGYNPIKYPSFVNRIEEETNRTLRAMKDAHQGEMQIRQDYLQGLRYKEQQEASNRRENFNLAQNFNKAYRATEQKQLDLEQRELNLRYQVEAHNESNLNKIKELIPKTLMQGVGIYGKRQEALRKEGIDLAVRYGVTRESAQAIANINAHTSSLELGSNKIIQNLENQVGPEVLNQFLDLSGARLHGFQVGAITNWAKYNAKTDIARLAEKRFDGKKSLKDLLSENEINSPDVEVVIGKIRQELYGSGIVKDESNPKSGGYDSTFVSLHAHPYIEKHLDEYRVRANQQGLTTWQQKKGDKSKQLLANAISEKGGLETGQPIGERVMQSIRNAAGGNPNLMGIERRKHASYIAEMVKNGQITYEEWEEIKAHKLIVGGKEVLLGEQWKEDWEVIENAFTERIFAQEKKLKDTQKEKIAKHYVQFESYRQSTPDGNFSFNELELIKDVMADDGVVDIEEIEYIKSWQSLLPGRLNATKTQNFLQSTYDSGQLSPAVLLDPRLDGVTVKQWEKFAPILGDPTVKNELKAVGQKVKERMNNLVASGELGSDTTTMVGRAEEVLRKNILQAVQRGEYDTPAEAAIGESIKLKEMIKNDDGDFKIDEDPNSTTFGKYLILQNTKLGRGNHYVRHIKNNKAFISTPGVFAEADLKAIQDTNINGIPDFIKTINRQYPKRDPYEIMNEILRSNNLKEIEPMGISKSYRYVHPRFKQLICNKPSMAKTCNAMFKTTKLMNPDYDPFLPMLDAIKDKGAVNTDEQYGGFDAYKEKDSSWLTGTEKFKKPLTEMLAGEVLNNQGLGRILSAGPYSIDQQDLRSMIEKGYVGLDEKFDENTQRRIAQLMLWERSGKFLVNTSEKGVDARTIIPGIGQEWVQIAGPGGHISEDEEVDIAQKLELVKQNLEKMGGFNLLLLRDEVQERMYHKLAGAS
jgi:hypothetical protein